MPKTDRRHAPPERGRDRPRGIQRLAAYEPRADEQQASRSPVSELFFELFRRADAFGVGDDRNRTGESHVREDRMPVIDGVSGRDHDPIRQAAGIRQGSLPLGRIAAIAANASVMPAATQCVAAAAAPASLATVALSPSRSSSIAKNSPSAAATDSRTGAADRETLSGVYESAALMMLVKLKRY